jgi:hypothetical protein
MKRSFLHFGSICEVVLYVKRNFINNINESRPGKVLFIPIPGAVTMAWLTWDTKSIIVCIMERMNLPMGKNILMALDHSGPMQKGDS